MKDQVTAIAAVSDAVSQFSPLVNVGLRVGELVSGVARLKAQSHEYHALTKAGSEASLEAIRTEHKCVSDWLRYRQDDQNFEMAGGVKLRQGRFEETVSFWVKARSW